MRWKFWQSEPEIETRSYTDAITDLVLAQARGDDAIANSRPAVLEACSGLWARAFASANIEPETPATAALTPTVMETIGRKLFENGEAIIEIQVVRGMVRLVQASSHTVLGGEPDSWLYELTIPTPDNIITRYRPAASVVHVRYASGFAEPWRGTGPIMNASTSRKLAAALELRLSQEANTAVGNLVPVPDMAGTEGLQADIKALKGNNVLVPSTRSDQFTGGQTPPRSDWEPRRLGANWPQTLQPMRADVSDHLAAAAGRTGCPAVPTGGRHRSAWGWRQFLHGTIQPIARIIVVELQQKLDTPDLSIKFDRLMASDIQGRARAFQSMVVGGMEITKAATLSGLIAEDD